LLKWRVPFSLVTLSADWHILRHAAGRRRSGALRAASPEDTP
jgi:hypothetical protein